MYTVPMALVDYIPVFLFAVAGVILMRDLYNKMSKGAYALFAAGILDIALAGFLKATHKLLYAANVCDFERLYAMFFPTQSLGFLLGGIGLIALLSHKQGAGKIYGFAPVLPLILLEEVLLGAAPEAAAPPVYTGTMIFILMMVIGLGAMDTCLAIIAGRMKKKGAVVLIILSGIASLMMGYLGTKTFDNAMMNWTAELINTASMSMLFAAVMIMHKAGLADAEIME